MDIAKTSNIQLREAHSFFEGISFICVILLKIMFIGMNIASAYLARFVVASENTNFFGVILFLGIALLYVLIAAFTKIKSFAIECAFAGFIVYAITLFKFTEQFFHEDASSVAGLIIFITGIPFLMGVLFLALRKSKYQNEEVTHTYHYKIYRFFRSIAFVIFGIGCIYAFNNNVIFPSLIQVSEHFQERYSQTNTTMFNEAFKEADEYIKDYIDDFKYIIQKIALIGGIEGIFLIILGFLSSIFSLGIELIIIGWILLGTYIIILFEFLYTIRYFVKYEVYTIAGLATKMSLWHIYAINIAVLFIFLILLFILVRIYIKKYNPREGVQH